MKLGKEKQHIQSRKEQKRECGLRSKQGGVIQMLV